MAFSPAVEGCLLKKGLQKGDHGHPRTPLATPLSCIINFKSLEIVEQEKSEVLGLLCLAINFHRDFLASLN